MDPLYRVQASVLWEDSEQPPFDVYFDTIAPFANDINCNPNAFLVAAIIPAMHHGERRIRVEGKLCPQLRNGLITAMHQLRAWYGAEARPIVEIEAADGFEAALPRALGRTASFMSGGIDAMAALRRNRLDFPLDHPGSIRDCLFVHGLDLGAVASVGSNSVHFEWACKELERFGEAADFTLLPVYTNAASIGGSYEVFVMESHGAVIAAIAHAFGMRISRAVVASSESVYDASPWGSSPLLDPNYSTADLEIKHDSTALTRLEKVGFVSQWGEALKHLRSCFDPQRGCVLNCERCEKCLRTMTALLAHGKLHECPAFSVDDVSSELLQALNSAPGDSELSLLGVHHEMFWEELCQPLRALGRDDLAAVIEAKMAEAQKARARREERDWIGRVKRADRRFTRGLGRRLVRACRSMVRG